MLAASLALPARAAAHSTRTAIAVDTRVEVGPATRSLRGIAVGVVDGNRALRLQTEGATTLTVNGYLGEPFLRFTPRGVWVDSSSPTAIADKLVPASPGKPASGWRRVTADRSLFWHDHRLTPPMDGGTGVVGRWSIPIVLDGTPRTLSGTFVRAAQPPLWLWVVPTVLVAAALLVVARRSSGRRSTIAAVLAICAALAGLTASAGFATGTSVTSGARWIEVGAAAILALVAIAVVVFGPESRRGMVAAFVGAIAALMSVGSLGVFRHGVVLSSLPADATRLATATAVAGGLVALAVGFTAPEAARATRRRR
jgi:hypothetical protein